MDDAEPLGPGSTFADLRVEERIATGGMSVLYRAVDPTLGRTVALKVMATRLSADDSFRKRFLSECRAASAIDHPNVIPLYTAGEHDGRLYITMRYVPGGSDLRKLLRASAPFDRELAVGVLAQVAAALDAVHAAGLVHRDVKPENVLLAATTGIVPHVYLTDFGISRGGSDTSVTEPGSIVGTLAYAAPEQITSAPVSARTDVYGLGCMAYECLTATRPFTPDNDAALLYSHLHDAPDPVSARRPGLPKELDGAVARGLAKDPAERPASAGEFVRGIAAALGVAAPVLATPVPGGDGAADARAAAAGADTVDLPALSTPSAVTRNVSADGSAEPVQPTGDDDASRRRKLLAAIGAVAVLLLVAVAAFAATRGGGSSQLVSSGGASTTTPSAPGAVPTGAEGSGSTAHPGSTLPGIDGTVPVDGSGTTAPTDTSASSSTPTSGTSDSTGLTNTSPSSNPTVTRTNPTVTNTNPTVTVTNTTVTYPPTAPRSVVAKNPQSTPVCDAFPTTVNLTIEWQAPQSDGGAAVTSFKISIAAEGPNKGAGYATTVTVAGNNTSTQVTVPGQPSGVNGGEWYYAYDVVAINAKGTSPSARAVAVMPDVVGAQLCDGDYWRRARAVGLKGYTPNPIDPPSCALNGRVYDQAPYSANAQHAAGTAVYVKVYNYIGC